MATLDDLDARLRALEAARPTPLAAVPPIRIGELSDVPTPGSTIAAAWAQEVTNRCRHRFATVAARDAAWTPAAAGNGAHCVTVDTNTQWTSTGTAWVPLKGTAVEIGYQGLPNINTVNTGWYDLTAINQAKVYPFTTLTVVSGGGFGGFAGGGPCNFSMDIMTFAPSAVIGDGQAVQAATALYAGVPLGGAWANAANVSVGFKVRCQFISGSNIHTHGAVTWTVYAY